MNYKGTPMTRDEALLWLNDRLGKDVHVGLEIRRGTRQGRCWRARDRWPLVRGRS